MSIAYAIFGVPRTKDEVVNKALQKVIPVEISVRTGFYEGDGFLFEPSYEAEISASAGTGRVVISEQKFEFDRIPSTIQRLNMVKATLREALAEAGILEDRGVGVTINGAPVCATEEIVERYAAAHLDHLARGYGQFLREYDELFGRVSSNA